MSSLSVFLREREHASAPKSSEQVAVSRPRWRRPLRPGRAPRAAVAARARRHASCGENWRALAQHDPGERWFLRLASHADYDTWLIGWAAHQGVDLHDHGGSSGALYVVEGELYETSGRRDGLGELHEQQLVAGHRARVRPEPRPPSRELAAQVATSIHVYSPPLVEMDFYTHDATAALTRTHTEPALATRSGRGRDSLTASVDELLAAARARLRRVTPTEAADAMERGALLVDTRPLQQRRDEGEIPGAKLIERNVLEWRLDPRE